MSKKKKNIPSAIPPPEVQAPKTKAKPPMEGRAGLVALCAVAVAIVRIVSSYSGMGITFDEPAHLACGLQYLHQHVYQYEPQHPPLARVMVAVGPYLSGIRPKGLPNKWNEGVEDYYQGGHTTRTVALSRLGILPFFVLACLTLYWWGCRDFNPSTGALAVVLFTLVPPVLAHGGLATTDMALTACLGAAFFAMRVWAEEPSLRHSLLFGASVGLAVASKFTALGFFPAAAAMAAAAWVAVERPSAARARAILKTHVKPLLIAMGAGAITIWALYRFSFGQSEAWGISLPAPELFDGIARAVKHNRGEGGGYLFGKLSPTGFWYFFPVILSLKTPIGFLLLTVLGLYLVFRWRHELRRWLPLALVLGVLLPAMTSPVNYGVRHVLPIYLGLSLIAARVLVGMTEYGVAWKTAAAGLVLWIAASGAIHHPDYLAYGNELVGREPENVMVDSDLDWGQGTIRLARRLRELGATSVGFFTMNFDSEHLQKWPGLPPVTKINPLVPAEGWTAVSPTFWKVGQYGLDHRYPGVEPWFTAIPPAERVGPLILYYVPPGALKGMQ